MGLIDKQTTLQVFDNIPTINGLGLEPVIALRDVKEIIKAVPEVDAAPVVHGKWEWLSSTYDRTPCEMRYRCSKCYHETITHDHMPWEKYCPNCGVLMDLEAQNAR